MRPTQIVTEPKELLSRARKRHGSLKAVCDLTGLDKSTLLRIDNGTTKRVNAKTRGKLLETAGE